MQVSLKVSKNVQILTSTGFIQWFYQYLYKTFLPLNLTSTGTPMLGQCLVMKNGKSLASDVFDTFATHADLFFTTSWTQTAGHKMTASTVVFLENGGIHSCVLGTFKH